MRKFFSILAIFLLTVAFSSSRPVYAQNETVNTTSIEEKDIQKLTIDPAKEVPADKIVPPPTPSPSKPTKKTEEKDRRSWTKFEHKDIIEKVSKQYSLDPQMIYATIMTESEGYEYAFRYEPHIKDASLCMGQVLIGTARGLGFNGDPKEMYKPDVCIDLIGKYYRKVIDTYGELTPIQLVAAYNTGSPWKRAVPGHISRFNMWYNEES